MDFIRASQKLEPRTMFAPSVVQHERRDLVAVPDAIPPHLVAAMPPVVMPPLAIPPVAMPAVLPAMAAALPPVAPAFPPAPLTNEELHRLNNPFG